MGGRGKGVVAALFALAFLVVAGVFWLRRPEGPKAVRVENVQVRPPRAAQPVARAAVVKPKAPEPKPAVAASAAKVEEKEAPAEAPETAEDREEKLVNAFDDLTDKWQEPAADKVTMEEINTFRDRFNQVPKARKEECLQRALNLVPDENVMLLAGILFDKSQERELLETVYNDILNRDEEVKKPILKELFKDKAHPCWADTAWILDVTDELPKQKKANP